MRDKEAHGRISYVKGKKDCNSASILPFRLPAGPVSVHPGLIEAEPFGLK